MPMGALFLTKFAREPQKLDYARLGEPRNWASEVHFVSEVVLRIVKFAPYGRK